MQELNVPYKTTFYTLVSPILITNEKGKEFYFYEWDNDRFNYQLFNLPKGKYYSKYPVFLSDVVLNFQKIPNEPPEKEDYLRIKKIIIKEGKNSHKASIYIYTNKPYATIIYDSSLNNEPSYIKDFILGHELGHLYYKTEEFCDRFSRNLCLSLGYNPSQLNKAIEYSLNYFSNNGNHRINISKTDNYFTSLKTALKYGR
jgi:hypothetical protein